MITFRENYGQIFSTSTGSSVSSDHAPSSSWPNVAAQAFAMDNSATNPSSQLWNYKAESPPLWGSTEKSESPLWDTNKDPWDVELSHQLAAKLLMLDDSPTTSQLLDQQLYGQHSASFTYGQDLTMANSTANPR